MYLLLLPLRQNVCYLVIVALSLASAAPLVAQQPTLKKTLLGHGPGKYKHSGVTCLALSPDGKTLASGSLDATVKLWDADTGQDRATLKGHNEYLFSVAFSPDGKTLASAGGSTAKFNTPGEIKLWDLVTGKERFSLTGHPHVVFAVAFSLDGKVLASGAADSTVRLWDPETGKQTFTFEKLPHTVNAVAFSPDGKILAAAGPLGYVRLWDTGTRQALGEMNATDTVWCLAFSPDGKTLATGNNVGAIQLWDIHTRQERIKLKGLNKDVRSVAFRPDGQVLASGGTAMKNRLWDLQTGKALADFDTPNQGGASSMIFSRDGKTLAVGATHVELWDVSAVK